MRTASGRGRRAVRTFAAGRHGRVVYPVLRLPRELRRRCRSGDHVLEGLIAAVGLADAMRFGVLVHSGGLVGQTSRLARFLPSDSHVGWQLCDSCSVPPQSKVSRESLVYRRLGEQGGSAVREVTAWPSPLDNRAALRAAAGALAASAVHAEFRRPR